MRQGDGLQNGDLLAMALENVAAGVRNTASYHVHDTCARNAHRVATIYLYVVNGISRLQQILETNCNGLSIRAGGVNGARCAVLVAQRASCAGDDYDAAGFIGYTSGLRQQFEQSCRPDDLIDHRLLYPPHK